MFLLSLGLILISAVCHGAWNIIALNAKDKQTFLWLQLVVNVILLAVPVILICDKPDKDGLIFLLVSGILQAVYYILLAKTYTIGEIDTVYPLLRGMSPVLVCIISAIFGLEYITLTMFISILVIVIGIYIINLDSFDKKNILKPFVALVKTPATRLSLLLSIIIALYTITDKRSVSYNEPFFIFYAITVIPMLVLAPIMIKRGKIKAEIKANAIKIIIVAILTFAAYTLVLAAMKYTQASYVSSIREVSVVFVAAYTAIVNKTKNIKTKITGSVIIFAGIFVLSLCTSIAA